MIIRSLPRVPAFPYAFPWLMRGKVRVKNASGQIIPFGGCMRVTTTTIVGNCIVATVDQPDTTFRRSYLVNCGGAIAADSNARGWGSRLGEDGLALYNGSTPTVGAEYGPKSGQWKLEQDYPGFLITGATQAVGANNAVVAMQVTNVSFVGKASGSIALNATTGTVAIWTKNFGAATGQTLTNCANYTSALADTDKVTGSFLSGGPIVAKLVC